MEYHEDLSTCDSDGEIGHFDIIDEICHSRKDSEKEKEEGEQ